MVIQNIIPQHLDALISKLKEMGIKMEKIGDSIVVYGNDGNLKPVEHRHRSIQDLRLTCSSL